MTEKTKKKPNEATTLLTSIGSGTQRDTKQVKAMKRDLTEVRDQTFNLLSTLATSASKVGNELIVQKEAELPELVSLSSTVRKDLVELNHALTKLDTDYTKVMQSKDMFNLPLEAIAVAEQYNQICDKLNMVVTPNVVRIDEIVTAVITQHEEQTPHVSE